MARELNPADLALVDNFQHGFPLASKPFETIGDTVGLSEDDVIARYERLRADGFMTRIGAIVAPNTIAASTLAAMQVPAERLEEVAAFVTSLPFVNHNYLRENPVNLWFVVTAPAPDDVTVTLNRIESETGLAVRDLRLVEPYHLDLGFSLTGKGCPTRRQQLRQPDPGVIRPGDRELLAAIEDGIPLLPRPFEDIAKRLDWQEDMVTGRLSALSDAHVIRRFGVIVRHRKLGISENAMAVWDIPDDEVSRIGRQLAAQEGVTLCYQRARAADWNYNLYCMVHGRSRKEAEAVIERLNVVTATATRAHQVLFSTRCYKQIGARFSQARSAA